MLFGGTLLPPPARVLVMGSLLSLRGVLWVVHPIVPGWDLVEGSEVPVTVNPRFRGAGRRGSRRPGRGAPSPRGA